MVQLRSRLRAAGDGDDEVRQQLRAGKLAVVRRGAHVAAGSPDHREPRHLAAVRAAARQLCADAVFSHVSAALLRGWDVWGLPLGQVRVTRSRRSGARVDPAIHVYAAPLGVDEIEMTDGIPLTAAARIVVDVARTVPFEQAVVTVDSALASGDVTAEEPADGVARQKGWPGAPRARRVPGFADGRSGSVGESRSQVAIARAGLPAPELQREFRDRFGDHVATVDVRWAGQRLVGEFDGLVTYGRLLRPGETAADAVVAEKIREDAPRDQDARVLRRLWADLADLAPTADRLRRRLQP